MKRVAIITSSDAGYAGEREDKSGPAIKEIAEKLSVSEQTVKNQLGDITRRLRHEVNRKNFLFFI